MVQAICRAMEIIRLIADSESGLRLFEIAETIKLKRTTVFNIAATLVDEGMLVKQKGARYTLGPAIEHIYLKKNKGVKQQVLEKAMIQLKDKYPNASVAYTELSGSDLLIKIHIFSSQGAQIEHPQMMKINPYLSVAGLIFFAFMNDDALLDLKANYPFEYKGLEWWKNESSFLKNIKKTATMRYAESDVTPENILKYGAPVFGTGGALSGSLTLTFEDKSEWEDISSQILKDLLDTASICSQ